MTWKASSEKEAFEYDKRHLQVRIRQAGKPAERPKQSANWANDQHDRNRVHGWGGVGVEGSKEKGIGRERCIIHTACEGLRQWHHLQVIRDHQSTGACSTTDASAQRARLVERRRKSQAAKGVG